MAQDQQLLEDLAITIRLIALMGFLASVRLLFLSSRASICIDGKLELFSVHSYPD